MSSENSEILNLLAKINDIANDTAPTTVKDLLFRLESLLSNMDKRTIRNEI